MTMLAWKVELPIILTLFALFGLWIYRGFPS